MQNENNSHKHWKQHLAEAENGSVNLGLNKEAAWEKLNLKLQQKSSRRKAILYWVAAACLLPLLLIIWLPSHRLQNHLAVKNNHTNVVKKPALKEIETIRQNKKIAYSAIAVVKKKREIKMSNINRVISRINKQQTTIANADSSVNSTIAFTAVPVDSNTIKSSSSLLTKKKLKVVHNNELNEPSEPLPVMAHNIYRHSFPLQIARGEVYVSSLQAAYKTSFISFRPKPSTN